MSIKRVAAVTFLPSMIALAASVVACTGLDPTPTPIEITSPLCSDYCTKLNACDNTRDLDTCTNLCQNVNAATLPKVRAKIVNSMSSCLEAKDCNTVLNKDPIATCADEAVAASAPSEAATSFCDSVFKAKMKCGSTSNKADCLNGAKLFNDSAVAEAQKCTEKSCSDISACVAAALGAITSGSTSPPPNETASGSSSGGSSSGSSTDGSPPPAPSGSGTPGGSGAPPPPSDGGSQR